MTDSWDQRRDTGLGIQGIGYTGGPFAGIANTTIQISNVLRN